MWQIHRLYGRKKKTRKKPKKCGYGGKLRKCNLDDKVFFKRNEEEVSRSIEEKEEVLTPI